MKETKRSPAPWVRDGYNLVSIIRCVVPRGHPDAKHTSGDYEEIARCTSENWSADSKLIAAAPDLLASVFDLLACAELNQDSLEPETIEAISRARNAVNKSEGLL